MDRSRVTRLVSDLLGRIGFVSRPRAAPPSDALRDTARALDRGDFAGAIVSLRAALPDPGRQSLTELAFALWRRTLAWALADQPERSDVAMAWFDTLHDAIRGASVWPVLRDFDAAAGAIGAPDAARVLVALLRGPLGRADAGLKARALVLVLDAGDAETAETLLVHLLATDPGFVPGVWQMQALLRLWDLRDGESVARRLETLAGDAGRPDIARFLSILRRLLRQEDPAQAFALAETLEDAGQRAALAEYLTGAAQHPDGIDAAAALHDRLAPPQAADDRRLMQARQAVAHADWQAVLRLTDGLLDHPGHSLAAVCLRALALARTGDHDNAAAAVRHVRSSPDSPWFLRGRAALISVSLRAARQGTADLSGLAAPALAPGAGRPLAQSLWVGPSLRWIERMSMQSFLLNGWRYKLYVYDEPAGVPDGVELADAAAILPRSAVFREGAGSGAHRGSLGAFSDLFRYALLERRGGFWTDTDVISLDLFDPEGARFVASEWTDAGLIGPNGAQMAAPPGDPLQRAARVAAEEALEDGDLHFARIGPELLAELLAGGGLDDYALMPPAFLNPIGWMQTGRLVAPFARQRLDPAFAAARSIHVYTETWRLIGLGLDRPPPQDSFLARMQARIADDRRPGPNRVRALMEMP